MNTPQLMQDAAGYWQLKHPIQNGSVTLVVTVDEANPAYKIVLMNRGNRAELVSASDYFQDLDNIEENFIPDPDKSDKENGIELDRQLTVYKHSHLCEQGSNIGKMVESIGHKLIKHWEAMLDLNLFTSQITRGLDI